jgi:DNA-binding protein YbaB
LEFEALLQDDALELLEQSIKDAVQNAYQIVESKTGGVK